MKKSNRSLLFVIICVLLCAVFALSVSATEAPEGGNDDAISDAIKDTVNDAINDAVNDAVDGAIDNITGEIENGLGNIEIPEAVGSILEIHSIEDANVFLSDFEPTVLFIMAACSIALALFGYRLLKLALALIGFAGGWTIGSYLFKVAVDIKIVNTEGMAEYVPFVVYAVCGIIFALIAFKLFKFGIFLGAAVSTFLFLAGVSLFNELVDGIIVAEGDLKYILARLVVAVIVGLLATVFTKFILILTTSALGGTVGGVSLMVAIGQTANPTVETVVGLVIVFIGLLVQFRSGKKRRN